MSDFFNLSDYLNDPSVISILKRNNVPFERMAQRSEVPKKSKSMNSSSKEAVNSKTTLDNEVESVNAKIESLKKTNNGLFDTINKNNETIKLKEIENTKLQSQIDSNVKTCDALRKSNSELFDKVAVNNESIEKLELQKADLVKKIEAQKKIAQDPLFKFKEDVLRESKSKRFDVSTILNQFEQLYKEIKEQSVHVAIDKIPGGKYDLMIESTLQGFRIKNKVSTFRSLFNMLNSMF